MIKLEINQFITVILLDSKVDFFTHMSGTDNIIIDNFTISKLADVLNKHRSQMSMMESSIIGNDTIERNKEKILYEVNNVNGRDILVRYLIVRYNLPDNITPVKHDGRIVGWQTITYPKPIPPKSRTSY